MTSAFDSHHFDFSPWFFWTEASADEQQRQRDLQADFVRDHPAHVLGEEVFISELAAVQTDELRLGDRTYIAANAYVTGSVRTGRDCTINVAAVVRGDITIGDAVRIGAYTSIIAFNHGFDDVETEIFRQHHTSKGIVIEDDVWIGSGVTILDGITIGTKSVLAAGAVVTKDVPAGSIVGGNPGRVLRSRFAGTPLEPKDRLGARLAAFGDRARMQAAGILARSWMPDLAGGVFVDRPGADVTVRAQCDAIEIAALLWGRAPDQLPAEMQRDRLRAWQDPETGLVPRIGPDAQPAATGRALDLTDGEAAYHVECVGYALDLLGSRFAAPIAVVADMPAEGIVEFLAGRAWQTNAWGAGHDVDSLGTALHWNLALEEPGRVGAIDAYFGWLLTNVDPRTGMWGSPSPDDGLLQVVNGYYRLTRGSFAQFGVPLPHPERAIDTVLAHSRDARFFEPDRLTACNVLDVAHPLWLLRPQVGDYRASEIRALAGRFLDQVLTHWIDGLGFGFQAPAADGGITGPSEPGLQGTEMWLATTWLLADLVGASQHLGYRPRGIHRPEPARSLGPR